MMFATLLPSELTDEIATHLSPSDMLSLALASRSCHDRSKPCLLRAAVLHKTDKNRRASLTKGLRNITFWFDRGSTGSALE